MKENNDGFLKQLSEYKNIDYAKRAYGIDRNKFNELNNSQREILEVIDEIIEMEEDEVKHMKVGKSKDFNILYRKLISLLDNANFKGRKTALISRSRLIRRAHRNILIKTK